MPLTLISRGILTIPTVTGPPANAVTLNDNTTVVTLNDGTTVVTLN